MWGYILLILTWVGIIIIEPKVIETTVYVKPPQNGFVVKTFEENRCIGETGETVVWRTVESVKVEN